MSDLIDRKALRLMKVEECAGHSIEYAEGWKACIEWIKTLPSAEPERTAKVVEHDASVTDTDGYKYHRSEYLCGACKKKVLGGDDYCSHCGVKLEWGE